MKTFKQFIKEDNKWTKMGQRVSHRADTCGSCAFVAQRLTKHLRNRGHDAHYVWGSYDEKGEHPIKGGFHAWVAVGKRIIDPTHGQFSSKEPTVVRSARDKRYKEYKRDEKAPGFRDQPETETFW